MPPCNSKCYLVLRTSPWNERVWRLWSRLNRGITSTSVFSFFQGKPQLDNDSCRPNWWKDKMNEQVTPDCVLRMCVEVEAINTIFSLLRHWKFQHWSAAAALIYNPIYSKEITLPLRAVQSVCYTVSCWRRKRDLNPRAGFPTYSLSRGAPSPLGYFSKCWNQDIATRIQYTAPWL